jgi:type I restriction enzyme M protein
MDDLSKQIFQGVHEQKKLERKQTGVEAKLQPHKDLEKELKDCKATIKEIKDRREELIAKAREKITPEEAEQLILARWQTSLQDYFFSYLRQYEQALRQWIEGIWEKYHQTLTGILQAREEQSDLLNQFLTELGYE